MPTECATVTGSQLDHPVRPQDVAFCLALPVDRSGFERAADARFDYVPSWLRRWSARRDPLEAAWAVYAQARIPQELQRLCHDLAASGVRVEAAVTREQLGRCLR